MHNLGSSLEGLLWSVVFIDDKSKHTASVNTAIDGLGIEDFEFRYGAADEKVKAFDPALAEVELCYFEKTGVILSDDEAQYETCKQ